VTTCPTHEALLSYESGELADIEAEPIQLHLRECATCMAALTQIRADDPLGQHLRTVFSQMATGTTLTEEIGGEVEDGKEPCVSTGTVPVEPLEPGESGSNRPGLSVASSSGADQSPVLPSRSGSIGALGSADWPIPDYERVLLCGEGSYGSVWAVRDRVGVYRALKIIDTERMGKAGVVCRERAALETYCRKITRHPYLVTVYHVGEIGSLLYYTMELADDRTMRGLVRDTFPENYRPLTLDTIIRGRQLQVEVALELARRLLRGLAKLHSLDLVHRDIKPTNIIFVNRHPKLADIGVMTAAGEAGRVIGTPRYMPPDKIMDQTADIYAFGKVLHEMIAGRDAPTFPELPADCQWGSMRWDLQRVNDVIVRACSSRAADRYPSASAMLEDLEASTHLPFDSLFEELASASDEPPPTAAEVALELGYAFIRVIPWILGFIAVIYGLSRL